MEEGCEDQEVTLLCKSREVKMAFSDNNDLKLCTKKLKALVAQTKSVVLSSEAGE